MKAFVSTIDIRPQVPQPLFRVCVGGPLWAFIMTPMYYTRVFAE